MIFDSHVPYTFKKDEIFCFRSLTFEGIYMYMHVYKVEIAYTGILLNNTSQVQIWSQTADCIKSYAH